MSTFRLLSVAALALSFAFPLAAEAQTAPAPLPSTAPAPGHHHGHRRPSLMRALRTLDLSDAQKQQIAGFHAQEVAANKGADPATRRANAATFRNAVMGVLSTDQKAQLETAMHRGRNAATMPAATPAPQ